MPGNTSVRRTLRWPVLVGIGLVGVGLAGGMATGAVLFGLVMFAGLFCLLIAGVMWLIVFASRRAWGDSGSEGAPSKEIPAGWRRVVLIASIVSIVGLPLGIGLAFLGLGIGFSGRPSSGPVGGVLMWLGVAIAASSYIADLVGGFASGVVWRKSGVKLLFFMSAALLVVKVVIGAIVIVA